MHVLVVGAGASGLCSAKHALEIFEKEETLKVTVVEKTQNVGGIWGSSDSPVYTNLHTNLPKELMAFPEFPFPPSEKSFVHHDKMASYLEAYAREYELQKHIRLGWEVVRVFPEKVDDGKTRWHVEMMELTTGSKKYEFADLLMICSGVREHSPRVPESSTKFTGDQMHSSEYRQADDPRFKGKTVMLAGGGPSGLDIASELSDVAQKVILSRGRGGIPVNGNLANEIEMVGGIKSIDGNIVWKVSFRDFVWNFLLEIQFGKLVWRPYIHHKGGSIEPRSIKSVPGVMSLAQLSPLHFPAYNSTINFFPSYLKVSTCFISHRLSSLLKALLLLPSSA